MTTINYWKLFTQGQVDALAPLVIIDGVVLDTMTCYNNHDPNESTRRQYEQARIGLPIGNHKMNFDLVVPGSWEFRPEWININDIHTRHGSPPGQSMNMYIVGSDFHLTFPNQYGGPNRSEFTFPIIKDKLYRFRNSIKMTHKGKVGFFKLIVDGVEIHRATVHLTWNGDEIGKGMYWKIGPYVGRDNWPEGVNSRTLYLRV